MKLTIFIGHFKTGSTSLQNFLAGNFATLIRHGILYPSVEAEGASANMAALLAGDDFDFPDPRLNVTEPHNALALRLKNEEDGHEVPSYHPFLPPGFHLFQMIENQIQGLYPDHTILCSEVFSLFGFTEKRAALSRMAARYREHEVTIYAHIRKPDDYLSSWHRQRLKFGERIAPLHAAALGDYLSGPHFQHAAMVEAWMQAFPDARLVLRDFEEVKKSGGAIQDFIAHADIPFPDGMRLVGNLNASVPSAFAEIGRRAQHDLAPENAAQVVPWLLGAAKRVPHLKDAEVEMFGESNRQFLQAEYLSVNQQLAALAGKDGLFFDPDAYSKVAAISDVEAARQALPLLVEDAYSHTSLNRGVIDWLRELQL